ncbi:hypothetical protein BDV25DRAFT_29565 [Aspergillus avenaceus]|uniref:Uncharacterized protein n=1 Tax=Aspergillus avenaceus TaxID=36643 RepID=A0A5N6TMS4_ASPAV|nr:hypothetical protein BDV25DRAFT_29565 [Aspergillus avenaceus]
MSICSHGYSCFPENRGSCPQTMPSSTWYGSRKSLACVFFQWLCRKIYDIISF